MKRTRFARSAWILASVPLVASLYVNCAPTMVPDETEESSFAGSGDAGGTGGSGRDQRPGGGTPPPQATPPRQGTPKPTPTPAPTPAPIPTSTPAPGASCPAPKGQDAGQYRLVFRDEFEGTSLNGSVWNDTIWYEASNPTRNYAVEGGSLKIWPQRDASGQFFNRTIDTDGKYYQKYGFFEIEAKLSYGKGTWPAFWLFNHPGGRRPEIDVMEAYAGGGPNSGWSDASLHPTAFAATVWIDANVNGGHKVLQTGDLSAGFHTYALKWEPNSLRFYFDGKEFYFNGSNFSDDMYLMLDLWYGSASGTPDDSTPQGKGNSYEVKYIRAWQFGSPEGGGC